MKLKCSGLLPSIEVGLCCLRKWGSRIITLYFKTSTVDVGECTAPAALVKTAQQSGQSTGKVAFHHSIF